tara:strand:- start:2387 stop:5812 length:3426 start_codon:yes stop_codon:yes gene_type:complete
MILSSFTKDALAHGKRVLPNESCGLLVRIDGVEKYWECQNISIEPHKTFVLNPDDWIKAEEASDEIIAVVHSHPEGSLEPSKSDVESCDFFQWPFYIFNPTEETWNYLEPKNYKASVPLKESQDDNPKLKTIRLYGGLARATGWKVLHADVTNTKSVLTFLKANWPDLAYEKISNAYQIQIGEEYINDETLDLEVEGDIRIVPVISGSWGFLAPLIGGIFSVKTVVSIATALVVNWGVSKLTDWFSGDQKEQEREIQEESKSTVFSGIQNVSRAGIPVPILYGEVYTGSNVLSAGIVSAITAVPYLFNSKRSTDQLLNDAREYQDQYAWSEGKQVLRWTDYPAQNLDLGTQDDPQRLDIVDLLGEGEIEGFPSASSFNKTTQTALYNKAALKDIYLDGAPILTRGADEPFDKENDYNVKNVVFTVRHGTGDQTPIPENDLISTPKGYNDQVLKEPGQSPTSVTKSLDNINANEAVVQLSFPQGLVWFNHNGGTEPKGVAFQVLVVMNTGVVINAFPSNVATANGIIYGQPPHDAANKFYLNAKGNIEENDFGLYKAFGARTTGVLSLDFRIDLDSYRNVKYESNGAEVGTHVTQIRIERLSDNDGSQHFSAFTLKSITEVIKKTPNYYYSAYGKLTINSDDFSGIPRRMYHLRGTKIKIPTSGLSALPATYYKAGTTLTINVSSGHGVVAGDFVTFNPTSGIATAETESLVISSTATTIVLWSATSQTVGSSSSTFNCNYKRTNLRIDSNNGRVIYPDGYVFNGTLTGSKHWCSDPAWILYDLLTNQRTVPSDLAGQRQEGYYDYGLGRDIDETIINKYSLFEASKYASELVHGEPRFSCNVVLKQPKQVYTLINDLCSAMRSMPYYSAGQMHLAIDQPSSSVYLFNRSNVSEEGFTYSGSSIEEKYTVVNVSYFNVDSKERDYITVEADQSLISKYGYRVHTIKGFACNSRAQAERLGRWTLHTQNHGGDLVSFTSTLGSGVLVKPGQVISIADPMKAGYRLGGRVSANTGNSTTVFDLDYIDSDVSDEVPKARDRISVLLPSSQTTTGSSVPYGRLETKTVQSYSNLLTAGGRVTVTSAFSEAPIVGSPWALVRGDQRPIDYKVVGVSEDDQLNYLITAIRYDANKYDEIDAATEQIDG